MDYKVGLFDKYCGKLILIISKLCVIWIILYTRV